MVEQTKTHLRKKLFINPKIQGRILWRCVIFWGVYHFLMLHTLLVFEFMSLQIQIMNGGSAIAFSELYSIFLGKYYPIVLTAMAIFPILAFDVLKMSHRIVGPLVPFQHAVKKLKNGEHVEEVNLRDGDLLLEFQEDFNEFLKWYNEQKLNPKKSVETSPNAIRDSEEEILAEIETLHKEAVDNTEASPQPESHAGTGVTVIEQPDGN